jgi:cell filamentation protein, protein adenylyltransferase
LTRLISPIAEAVARLHARFEQIHPFLDGNGRTGRLLTNLILVRLGYPPVIIQKRERSRYLAALDRGDHDDIGPLGELFARAILDNLNRFILPAVAGPARLVPLEALATPELKVTALRRAIERGRLRATRAPNGTWRSSRQWVNEYLKQRWSRGSGRPERTRRRRPEHPAPQDNMV